MPSIRHVAWLAALLGASTAAAAAAAPCTSNLLIDDFSRFSNGTNSLGSQASDDGSMVIITDGGDGVSFVPRDADSYFYESFGCRSAKSDGYTAVSFTLQGPAQGSFAVELQWLSSCSADTDGHSSSFNLVSNITGRRQLFTIPLDAFSPPANPDAIVAFAWDQFTADGVSAWTIGNVQLVCGGAAAPSTTTITTPGGTATASPGPSSTCTNLLIDDWESQSRLTFLNYNAMQQSSSDDGTMQSIVVDSHRVMLTPKDTDSYFYSQFPCVDAAAQGPYGGISFRVRAAAGTSFTVTLTSVAQCGGQTAKQTTRTTAQLGWRFDGTERLYSFAFSSFPGVDATKLQMIYLSTFNRAVILGPMSFYCGDVPSEYVLPPTPATPSPAAAATTATTVRAPSSTAAQFLVDAFGKVDSNSLGQWHGGDEGLSTTFGRNSMTISTNDSDLAWNTQLSETCADMRKWQNAYLHVSYTGSNKFSIALQQHNERCDSGVQPYPETWDSVEAARYATDRDIYVPLSHFRVNLTRVIGFAFKGFYTRHPTTFTKIEIVDAAPADFRVPAKLPSGTLVFSCTRPNSFAFAIDDGEPSLAQEVMEIVKSEGIPVTFFTVGLPLLDPTTNLSAVYRDMQRRGHQIAMHSYTHPKMEGLPDEASIDWEYNNDIGAVKQVFDGLHTPYFRPPFGTEGARMRQRLAAALGVDNPYIIQWSIDVEDWLWAETRTPERQLEAFKRDLAKGGNLVVMHYLYPSTVSYLRQFIQLAKATGKQLMRVDQCMMDPNAPPL